jgi:hypothetical protein
VPDLASGNQIDSGSFKGFFRSLLEQIPFASERERVKMLAKTKS